MLTTVGETNKWIVGVGAALANGSDAPIPVGLVTDVISGAANTPRIGQSRNDKNTAKTEWD